VRERGHHDVCRSPYRPQDGPVLSMQSIKYQVRWSEVEDHETMKTIVKEIIEKVIKSMDETCLHCGYVWN
jgi:hypothetical protein